MSSDEGYDAVGSRDRNWFFRRPQRWRDVVLAALVGGVVIGLVWVGFGASGVGALVIGVTYAAALIVAETIRRLIRGRAARPSPPPAQLRRRR